MLNSKYAICFVLFCAILFGCVNTLTYENVPQATIHLEKIIDKESQQPIENNTITLRLETPDGGIINTEHYQDQESFTTVMPSDGSVRLFIEVDSPGYKTWRNALRMNWNEDKPVYITVEMEREEGLEG
jgi:hypothetical protein